MGLHDDPFLVVERTLLLEDPVRHADLADIVHGRGGFDAFHLFLVPPQDAGHLAGIHADAPDVRPRFIVPMLAGGNEAI